MTTNIETKTPKYRTTLYLTEENKKRLDYIPKGKRTEIINRAIADILEKIEREKNLFEFMDMIATITPVAAKHSSVEMVRMLRENKTAELISNKN